MRVFDRFRSLLFVSLLLMPLIQTAQADTRTWLSSTTNWNDTANWTGGAVPANGDAVVITNSATKPYMLAGTYPASGAFLSFEVQPSATVYCMGATNVINEASGGTAVSPHGTGVTINCQSALINGTLNADYFGFVNIGGFAGPGYPTGYGFGGTYGGKGNGNLSFGSPLSSSCGSLRQPTALGSSAYYDGTANSRGSKGGGAIALRATGSLTLNGTITACGYSAYGGGSGGSIWLTCDTFQGSGTIRANGGPGISTAWGSGGGGRVALDYNASTFTGNVSAAGGGPTSPGQPGTLWETNRFTNAAGNVLITTSYQYFFPSTASNYTWGLTLTNGASVYFHDFTNGTLTLTNLLVTGGSTLRLDVDSTSTGGKNRINNIAITNLVAVTAASGLYLAECSGSFTSLVVSGGSVADFSISTNAFPLLQAVVVTNVGSSLKFWPLTGLPSVTSILMYSNTTLYLPSQTYTLTGDLNVPTNAVLYAYGNTNAVNPASGGTVSVPHGTGVAFNCQNALIDGTVSADSFGFLNVGGAKGPGYSTSYGYGGTYGGSGAGNPANGPPAGAYGSLTQPTALGSSGMTDGTTPATFGEPGSGAIQINATGALRLNGTITASGSLTPTYAGGSGGSVWLRCNAFQGSGSVKVMGGAGLNGGWCNGGGGRVAFEYGSSTFNGAVLVRGGTNSTRWGVTGTVFTCQSPVSGTTLSNAVSPWLDSQFSVSSNDLGVTRTVASWGLLGRYKWTDSSTTLSTGTVRTNVATYTMRNFPPFALCQIYDNGQSLTPRGTNTGANGSVTFSTTLDSPHTLELGIAAKGTIFSVW